MCVWNQFFLKTIFSNSGGVQITTLPAGFFDMNNFIQYMYAIQDYRVHLIFCSNLGDSRITYLPPDLFGKLPRLNTLFVCFAASVLFLMFLGISIRTE
jgi:hypothetical protein